MAENFNPITDGVKKLLLAGVGAVALTAEKANEIVDTLVEKGEITVEQGKDLNQELKRTFNERKTKTEATDEPQDDSKDIEGFVNGLSEEELAKLKEALKDKE